MKSEFETPLVSVVVASHRRNRIEELIRAFTDDITGELPWELIVVADYPVDAFVAHYSRCTWIFLDDISISAKRNKGVAASSGTIVGFIDDDCTPMDGWVKNAAEYFSVHPDHAAVEGRTTIEQSSHETGMIREYRRLEKPGFRTNNIFYKKEVFLSCGGFDERFTVQREDLDLAFSVLERGFTIGYSRDIRVEHEFRHWEKWDLLKNCVNRRFDPLLCKKHPVNYRGKVLTPFPPMLLLLLASYVFAVAIPLTRASLRPQIGVCVALGLISFVALRRTGPRFEIVRFCFEWVSSCVAPVVLLGALMYGSVRFRKVLIL